jgi:hypothetical protein
VLIGRAWLRHRNTDGAVMMMPENLIVFDGARKLVGL